MKKLFLIILLLPMNVQAFTTSAVSSILMDTDSGRVLYAKNPHHIQSVASISKIMTAIIAIENTDIKKSVTIGNEISKAYGSGIYIKQGEVLTMEDLLYGLMLRSGNDAALAIAHHTARSEEKFVELMNKKAQKLKMTDTIFNNPSGLDEKEFKGNFSSAYDMAILMSYAMQNKEFRKIVKTKTYKLKTNKNTYRWNNKNKLLSSYKYITGGKTGFTKKAKRTLVTTASKDDLNLTVVTINDGNDWKDHKQLYEEAFSKYQSYTILNKGKLSLIGEDYYQKNTIYLKKEYKYPLLDSEKDTVQIKFNIIKKRKFKTNDKVGKVIVYIGNKKVHKQNIYVKKSSKKWFSHAK